MEMDKIVRGRSTDLDEDRILLIGETITAPEQAQNLQPSFPIGSSSYTQLPPFGRMPIRKGIVDVNRQVFQPPTNFVIGDGNVRAAL